MNKHKTIKMILCLCLALVMLFSPVMDTLANAVAIAPWVTYAIITYMAACGIVFTATGGVQAMTSAVNEAWDDWTNTQTEIIDITDYIEVYQGGDSGNSGGSPDPNETGLQFGYPAAAFLAKFVEWLLDNGWSKGTTVENTEEVFWLNNKSLYIQGVEYPIYLVGHNVAFNASPSTTLYKSNSPCDPGYTVLPLNKMISGYGDNVSHVIIYDDYSAESFKEDGTIYRQLSPSGLLTNYGYSIDDIANCAIMRKYTNTGTHYVLCYVMNDGYVLADFTNGAISFGYNKTTSSTGYITNITYEAFISIPDEVPDISPSSDTEALRINLTEIFGDNQPNTVEEAANIIENVITDTGTLPNPNPEIVTLPNLNPTPAPTPNPSPEYEDVESLGLPALGDALMDKFPFCLPEDLGRLLNIFTAERQTPKWEVDLYAPLHGRIPMQGDTMLTIDLAEYEEIGQITRWASVIGFCLFLLVVTKEFITW